MLNVKLNTNKKTKEHQIKNVVLQFIKQQLKSKSALSYFQN